MDSVEAEEYMDVVTTYRCKFCDFSSEQSKDIAIHVKAVHVKPRTIVVAESNPVTTISDSVTLTSGPNVTVLPNPGSELIENIITQDSQDTVSDVVSRAVKESNLQVQKEAENENEALNETETTVSLESLIVEGANNDPNELNTILAYQKNGEENGQIVGYFSKGQIYTSLGPYQQAVVGEQVQGHLYGNNVQVVDTSNGEVTLSFVDFSGDKDDSGVAITSAACTNEEAKERAQLIINSEVQMPVHDIDIQTDVLRCENDGGADTGPANRDVQHVNQESASQSDNIDHGDTVSADRLTGREVQETSVAEENDMAQYENNDMHIIIENNDDDSMQRIRFDTETLKKTLVSSGTNTVVKQKEDLISSVQQNLSSSAQVDESNVTTKELYLCGNCSIGFDSIQECKDHMLAEHGQYAEDHETDGQPANGAKVVDAFTQVEPRKKPGRKKKSEISESLETVKEEVISDSGSDEDWSEKLNMSYSRSNRSKRKRRPPAALRNDYYLGKKGKSGEVAPTQQTFSFSTPREKLSVKCSLKGCTAKFRTTDSMEKHLECHIRGAPEAEPAFRCLSCSEKFFFWKQARFHMWKLHKIDVDLISCEVCEVFKTDAQSKLKAHMEVHGEDKPYVCNVCSKGFKQLAQMRNHQLIHRDSQDRYNSEGKWYSSQPCEVCGRIFANSKCLKKHVEIVHRKHKPFNCTYCNYTCARKAMLQLHLRTHTQEKPFKCDCCSYASGDHNSLRRHKMRHTGQRPYKCPHCPYHCIQAISLKFHIKNKHPGQEGVYLCHMCLYKTLSKTLFNNHLLDHKNGLVETLENAQVTQKAIQRRRQKPDIKPHISSVSAVYPKLLQQLQNPNDQPQSQIITLQATNIDSSLAQPQIIQLPSNPQVMQVEMQVQTNEAGENIISEAELAKLNNYGGLVQSDVAAAQLIFSALNAISQNAQQTGDTNEGAVVQEIVENKGEIQTAEVTNQDECVTHTITFHVPENGDQPREGSVVQQQGVTLVEVAEGVDGVELAQQIQSRILVAGQAGAEYM